MSEAVMNAQLVFQEDKSGIEKILLMQTD